MPKISRGLIDKAVNKMYGGTIYRSIYVERSKHREFCRLAGITKGQWKRWLMSFENKSWPEISVSETSIKKLQLMVEYGDSPHLSTLLRMVEAQMDTDHEL